MSIAPAAIPPRAHGPTTDSLDAILRWPTDRPLAAILSLAPTAHAWPTLLATPSLCRPIRTLDDLRKIVTPAGRAPAPGGGWLVQLDYELAALVEPTAFAVPGAPLGRAFRIDGSGDAPTEGRSCARFSAGPARSTAGRADYTAEVRRAVEYIHAGDAFQVNVAHHLCAPFTGSSRAFFVALARIAQPVHAAYAEWDDERGRHAVCSVSPELFLSFDASTRTLTTRPIKGTRPSSAGADALLTSEKDAAELAMIVDLMRNDLGRVAAPGTVAVTHPRDIERHGAAPAEARGILHTVATVSCRLRDGATFHDALVASFPPGSVTGAPKVRAMQIIHELERRPRAAYCGSIGFVADSGDAAFSVAIRTASIHGHASPGAVDLIDGRAAYPVGAGVVADSDPDDEWRETLVKAEPFTRITGFEDSP